MPKACRAGEASNCATEGRWYVWKVSCPQLGSQFHSLVASVVRRAEEFMFLEGMFFSVVIISVSFRSFPMQR